MEKFLKKINLTIPKKNIKISTTINFNLFIMESIQASPAERYLEGVRGTAQRLLVAGLALLSVGGCEFNAHGLGGISATDTSGDSSGSGGSPSADVEAPGSTTKATGETTGIETTSTTGTDSTTTGSTTMDTTTSTTGGMTTGGAPYCGDGNIDEGEECDNGDKNRPVVLPCDAKEGEKEPPQGEQCTEDCLVVHCVSNGNVDPQN